MEPLGETLAGLPGAALGMAILAGLAAIAATLLAWLDRRVRDTGTAPELERINALLPQIQCGQCGYPGCRPSAAALLAGEAPPDRCPPGGEPTRRALAALLGTQAPGSTPGAHSPLPPPWAAAVAVIDEDLCVGCARCIEVCPVDAIVGAHRYTHTVLAADCTGCELCIPACPVDCIGLVPAPGRPDAGTLRPGQLGMP